MNDDFEREWEKQMQFWEAEIDLFAKYLHDEEKLKSDTVDKHASHMQFVTEAYFMRYDIDYEQFDGETVVDFLGNFYIRKVLSSSKTEMTALMSAFKKWAQFLQHVGKISSVQCSGILRVCKHKEFFYERFESYMDADDEDTMEDWFYANDFEDYLLRQEILEPSASETVKASLSVDEKLLECWALNTGNIPKVIRDFQKFLQEIKEAGSIKLTPARQHLPRKFWKELDDKLGWHLFHKPSLNQDDIPLYQFFFNAIIELGLMTAFKNQAKLTAHAETFLVLTDAEQAALLMDALWNKVPWRNLQQVNVGGRPEVTQASRSSIARVLASWPIDQAQDAYSDLVRNKLKGQLFNGSTDVFLHSVIPVLSRFILITADFPQHSEIRYAFERAPIHMAVTGAGNRVFRYFQNQRISTPTTNTDAFNDLLISMLPQTPVRVESLVGRNDPCPCGSGKKYKKCCLQ